MVLLNVLLFVISLAKINIGDTNNYVFLPGVPDRHKATPCTTGGTILILFIKGGGLSKVFATDYSFSRNCRLRARKPIEHTTTGD